MKTVNLNSKTICPLMADCFNSMVTNSSLQQAGELERAIAVAALGGVLLEECGADAQDPEILAAIRLMGETFMNALVRRQERQSEGVCYE